MVLHWEGTGPSSQASSASGLNFHADHHTALHWDTRDSRGKSQPSSSASGLSIHPHHTTTSHRAAAPSAPPSSARAGGHSAPTIRVPSAQTATHTTSKLTTAPRAIPLLIPQAADSRQSCDKLLSGIDDMRRMGTASTPELEALQRYLQRTRPEQAARSEPLAPRADVCAPTAARSHDAKIPPATAEETLGWRVSAEHGPREDSALQRERCASLSSAPPQEEARPRSRSSLTLHRDLKARPTIPAPRHKESTSLPPSSSLFSYFSGAAAAISRRW
ncbi:hypothetical protein T484DRAFT_1852744 [Baffinella frigidus]|nr:hypothetical protein T484DRAFT_1852744 [Cryptophyta sp. CCMP2293]